jgi:hypothetical protein
MGAGGRLSRAFSVVALVGATATIGAIGLVGAAQPAMAQASCTFNGQASGTAISGVVPGTTKVAISCTGLPPSTSLAVATASPLAGVLTNPSIPADLALLMGSPAIGSSDASGNFSTTLTIPSQQAGTDPDAVCPPSQAQVNAGLTNCAMAVASLSGTTFGTVLLNYQTGQLSPSAPTLSLSPSSVGPGGTVTVSGSNWWGNGLVAVTPQLSGVAIASSNVSIPAAAYTINSSNNGGTLTGGSITGSFVVSCSATPGSASVMVNEPNSSPPNNSPYSGQTISASSSLTVSSTGGAPCVSSISPNRGPRAGGTTVTITGTGFTGATSVTFGTASAKFTVNSDTQITATSPPGSGTVAVVVTGPGGSSSTTPTAANSFTYGLNGYRMAGLDGGAFNFGDATYQGSLPGLGVKPNAPIVGMASTPDGKGYWMAGADGGVYAFGDARFFGSMGGTPLNEPVVGMAATPDGKGYWLVASDGGIFSFGDASFFGSTGGLRLNAPVMGMASTSDGQGYWLVASDGGIFAFGDAHFFGSLGGMHLAAAISGIASPDAGGYWLVGEDGGVFAFGDAHYLGSLPGLGVRPAQPIISIVSPDPGGYWMVAYDGGVFAFGDAQFFGSLGGIKLAQPINAAALG